MSVKLTQKLKEAIDEMRDDYNQRVEALEKERTNPDFVKKCDSIEYKERILKEYFDLCDLERFLLIFTEDGKKDPKET